jgi:hypothetical protein
MNAIQELESVGFVFCREGSDRWNVDAGGMDHFAAEIVGDETWVCLVPPMLPNQEDYKNAAYDALKLAAGQRYESP